MNFFMLTPEILAAITILGQVTGDRIPGAAGGGGIHSCLALPLS